MTLSWKNLYLEVPNNNLAINAEYIELINNSSGSVKPGEVLAIMGPSGGGKTSLLKMLAGHIPKGSITQGEILYNEKPREKNEWTSQIGFVDQDDIVCEDFTIEENIRYSGQFRNKEFIEEELQKLLEDLRLTKVYKSKMKKVSGGQRKRTVIGIELISNPEILFLDEPTTGLDATSALKLVELLKKWAVEKQKIVILSIHQPSEQIFGLFDQVTVLYEAKQIYYGETGKIESFFSEKGLVRKEYVQLPEFIVHLCDKEFQKNNSTLLFNENSIFPEKAEKNSDTSVEKNEFILNYKPNLHHISLLIKRKLTILRFKKGIFIRTQIFLLILSSCLLILLIQAIKEGYNKNKNLDTMDEFKQYCSEIDAFSLVLSLFVLNQINNSCLITYEDQTIIEKELKMDVYSPSSYFLALMIFRAIIELIIPLIIFIPLVCLTKMNAILTLIAILLLPLISVPFGLCIGSITKVKKVSIIIGFLFGFLNFLAPSSYSMFIMKVATEHNGDYKFVGYLTYFLGLFSPLHFKAICTYFYLKQMPSYILKLLCAIYNAIFDGKVEIKNYLDLQFYYINNHFFNIHIVGILFVVSYVLIVLGGITFFGYNLMPQRRLLLEKNKV